VSGPAKRRPHGAKKDAFRDLGSIAELAQEAEAEAHLVMETGVLFQVWYRFA
jgi:hypothetical protein